MGGIFGNQFRMIAKLRTYRALPALLATLLVMSVSLPLVRYACGAAGAVMTTLAPAAHEVSDGTALCEHGHKPIRGALCVDAEQLLIGCEDGTLCTVKSENRPSALSIEAPSVRLDVAQDLTVARITPLIVFSHRPAFPWSDEAVEAQDRVPIRLRTSTLLL